MLLEEFGILGYYSEQVVSLIVFKINGGTLFEVIVFLGGRRVFVESLPTIPRTLDIVTLHNFLTRIEDIGHNHEVAATNLVTIFILFYDFMEAKEFSNEGFWVLLDIVVIVLQNTS